MTDDELLNNCTTHQAREGASNLKCGFAFPGEPRWAGDVCGSPETVGFSAAECCPLCCRQPGGLSLLLAAPCPLQLLLMGPFFLAETQAGVLYAERKAEGEMAEADCAPAWGICALDLASCHSHV